MRRGAILQRIEQEAKLELSLLRVDLECGEHLALNLGPVDTHRPSPELPAVEHHVIGLGHAPTRVGVHEVLVPILGSGKGMMHRAPALALFVKLEHREIDHPQRSPAGLEQACLFAKLAVADLQAQGTDAVVDDLGLVGTEKDQVAVLRAGALQDLGNGPLVQVLDDGALQALATLGDVIDLDPGQALGAVDLDELGVAVDLPAAELGALRYAQGHHPAARRGRRPAEDLEIHILHLLGQLGQFELDAQVGLVRAEPGHGLGVGHDREVAQIDLHGRLEDAADHALEQGPNVLLGHEGGLDVDLRELGLAVSAQVFVAKALGDLVVAIEPGDHEQLLEQLRRLRQRKKLAVMHAAGHQVVARALRRALGEHGRLDVDKAVLVEKLAHAHGHPVAQHQVVLHVGAAQIEHPMRQTGRLRQVVIVELKRWRDRGVEHHEFMAEHLDLAAGKVLVFGARRSQAHHPLDLHTELVAQRLGGLEHLLAVRITDHLHRTLPVAQIDKDHAAVIAPPVDPATQTHALTEQLLGHQTAVMRPHLRGAGDLGHKHSQSWCALKGT